MIILLLTMRNSFKFEINKSHPLRDGFLFKEITIVAKEILIVVIRDDGLTYQLNAPPV